MSTTLPESECTALRLSFKINRELALLESAKERRDWRGVRQTAQAIDKAAALLGAEQRMDQAGIVQKP